MNDKILKNLKTVYKMLLNSKYSFFRNCGLCPIPDIVEMMEKRGFNKDEVFEVLRKLYYWDEITLEYGKNDKNNLRFPYCDTEYYYLKFKDYNI